MARLDLRDGADGLVERDVAQVRDRAVVGPDRQALQALGEAQEVAALLEGEVRRRHLRWLRAEAAQARGVPVLLIAEAPGEIGDRAAEGQLRRARVERDLGLLDGEQESEQVGIVGRLGHLGRGDGGQDRRDEEGAAREAHATY